MGNKIKSRVSRVALFIFIHLVDFVTCISMRNASVPHYGVKDGTAQLHCDFEIGSDKLLDLKWYKDEKEFYRSSPTSTQVFPVEGVNVDVQRSNQKLVTLRNITLNTSGVYRCEVLADKSFQRLTHQGQMIVVALPLNDPEIVIRGDGSNRSHARVSIGERVIGNCTSYASKPPASLMLYINGQKPDFTDIIEYTPVNETGGLETSTLGFNFPVEPSHFPRANSKIELKCTASIGNHYRVSIKNLYEARFIAQPSSDRNQFSSSATSFSAFGWEFLVWGTFAIPFFYDTLILTLSPYHSSGKRK